ncbi:MAG: divergent polysaccharide deacetylase family protein [Candidatus Cloacimonetes bacterium]|nr:divergent polysaccharide deacetylase family protein [Candidatus Cloacimonadota bacterium]
MPKCRWLSLPQPHGSKATADIATMNSVISVLKNNGMYFIDSATTANSAVFTAAEELGVFSTRRDIFLDVPDVSDATLISKIESLGKYKGRNEPIVIITHCHNREKLDALKKFITQIEEMGVRIESLKKAIPEPEFSCPLRSPELHPSIS